MRTVVFEAEVTGVETSQAFDTIADFARYPDLVEAVRQVDMLPPGPGGAVRSRWAVFFRGGLLRWSETDWMDRAAGVITFEQDEGDFDVFRGRWQISPIEGGEERVRVAFEAEFDFGVPSLAAILEPVAARLLAENLELILLGLFGEQRVRILSGENNPIRGSEPNHTRASWS